MISNCKLELIVHVSYITFFIFTSEKVTKITLLTVLKTEMGNIFSFYRVTVTIQPLGARIEMGSIDYVYQSPYLNMQIFSITSYQEATVYKQQQISDFHFLSGSKQSNNLRKMFSVWQLILK